MDVREGLHRMLGSCTVASKTCLEMCIDKILENLKRYPQVSTIHFVQITTSYLQSINHLSLSSTVANGEGKPVE